MTEAEQDAMEAENEILKECIDLILQVAKSRKIPRHEADKIKKAFKL